MAFLKRLITSYLFVIIALSRSLLYLLTSLLRDAFGATFFTVAKLKKQSSLMYNQPMSNSYHFDESFADEANA